MNSIAEIACSEAASFIIDNIAKKHKMNPLHVASYVPGIVHNHPPCEHLVESCVYCKRNGNVFSNKEENSHQESDLISVYKRKLIVIFDDMMNEIQNTVDAILCQDDKDDDLEKMLLEALEDY